jgi:tetratricopeptide (TPR) repeat protein
MTPTAAPTMPHHPDFKPLSLLSAGPAAASEPWTPLPYADVPRYDARSLLAHWPRLHAGHDLPPPPPADGPLADGWALYHSGEFERAAALGLLQGADGATLCNQATAVYANYLEPRESIRLAMFRQVIERASAQAAAEPENCQALYWQAYALSRYSQGISVARALAQGLGGKLKDALERVISLQPRHADAHIALAAFHAEVIDKVGALVGRMTYGVRAETAIELFERGVALHPASAHALTEYGRALLMLHGESRMDDATRLYEKAAALEPVDARERLDVELARAGLSD